jgi:hypothetical protein
MSKADMTAPTTILVTSFGRLFDNEFATLDGITISCRGPGGVRYIDEGSALDSMLFGEEAALMPATAGSDTQALHLALYEAMPDAEAVFSGWSRHLRALLLEGQAPPPPTSMMKKRGIPDLGAHLVEPEDLTGERLAASVEHARLLADQNGMRHLLLTTGDGLVAVAGKPAYEAQSHWHNVEFAARIACLAIEERALNGIAAGGSDA